MPGDNRKELFVVVDEDDNVIGTATREACHSNNKIIHRGIHVFIINEKDEILVLTRSMSKDIYPGRFDFSTAGHVSPGETYEQTAVREIKEELGIEVYKSELIPVGKIRIKRDNESEIDMSFAVRKDIPIDDFKIDRAEVEKIEYYPADKIKKMLKRKEDSFITFYKMYFNLLCKHFRW